MFNRNTRGQLQIFVCRLSALFRKRHSDRELDEELQTHLALLAEDFQRSGMTPEEAQYAARRSMGGIQQVKELYRERRGWPVIEILLQDLRYAARLLWKAPSFSAIAVFALALGIGANTAIYSLADVLLLRPLQIPDLDRVVNVIGTVPGFRLSTRSVSSGDFLDFRRSARTLEHFAAFNEDDINITGDGDPQKGQVARVSAGFFDALGARPEFGRFFAAEEDAPGRSRVVVLGHGLWVQRYGAERSVLGKIIHLNGEPYQIVGVVPRELRYPPDAELWIPLALEGQDRASRSSKFLVTVGRLKAGVSLQQASSEMDILAREIAGRYPDDYHHRRGAKAELLRQNISGNATPPIVSMLLGAVGFVLLLACVNVANLQLARVSLRTREIALRFALGAGRLRILMQFLVESLLLSLAGAVAGAFAAIWATNVLHGAMPAEILRFLPGWERLGLNSHVLLFTLAAGALSGVISGFAPAFFASRTHLNETLKEAARGASSGVRRHRTRNAFVVAQIVLALVLLVGAELMVKGLRLVTAPAPNLDPVHALAMRVTLADARYPSPQERWIFQQRVLDRVSTLPGVESAALVRDLPYSGYGGSVNVAIRGQVIVPSRPLPPVRDESVSPDYFRTLHLPIAAGRPFTQHDTRNAAPVAIISQSFVRRHFPNENPIGKQLKIGKPDSANPWLTIVGVAGDIRMDPFEDYYPRILYRPIQQAAPSSFCLLLRTSDPGKLIAASRAEIHAIDPDLPVYDAMSLEKVFGFELASVNLIAGLMASFGVLALILSSVGVYSIMVHAVSERRHEIGVRMALGAMTSEVVWLFVRQSLTLAAIGVAIGMPAAFGLARMLEGRFFGVKATDAPTFAIALLIITVAAVAASYSAAQRAARLDPVATLREE